MVDLLNILQGKTLQGTPIHIGSWGLPDFGITEALQGATNPNAPLTPQGGSNLWGGQSVAGLMTSPATPTPAANTPTYGQYLNNTANNLGTGPQGPTSSTGAPAGLNTNPSSDAVNAINQLYGANDQYFQSQQDLLHQNEPGLEQQVQNQADQSIQSLKNTQQSNLATTDQQSQQLAFNQQSAMQQARQLYGQLMQRGNSMFGGGTSAGPAYSEILNTQTANNMNGIQNTGLQGQSQIAAAKNNINNIFAIGQTAIQNDLQQNLQKTRSDFANADIQIQHDRSLNQAAQAQARLDLLQQARQQAFSYQTQAQQNQQQLALYATIYSNHLNNYASQIGASPLSQQQVDFYNQMFGSNANNNGLTNTNTTGSVLQISPLAGVVTSGKKLQGIDASGNPIYS